MSWSWVKRSWRRGLGGVGGEGDEELEERMEEEEEESIGEGGVEEREVLVLGYEGAGVLGDSEGVVVPRLGQVEHVLRDRSPNIADSGH